MKLSLRRTLVLYEFYAAVRSVSAIPFMKLLNYLGRRRKSWMKIYYNNENTFYESAENRNGHSKK